MFFFFVVKPNITAIESDPKIAIIGNKLEITCKADSVPKPSYIIYHNGTKIFTGAKDKVEVTKSVTHSHAGNYTCTARNFLGIDTRSFNLSVKGKICCSIYCTLKHASYPAVYKKVCILTFQIYLNLFLFWLIHVYKSTKIWCLCSVSATQSAICFCTNFLPKSLLQ